MGGGTVIPDTDAMLDSVRTLLFMVWKALHRNGSIPKSDLVNCFRSFGLVDPLCEIQRKLPDLGVILRELEQIETSLMEVSSW